MPDIKAKYGAHTQAITITLASLAASATVGRESTLVDNGTNLFLDVLVQVTLESGTVSGNKQALVFAYGTVDDGTTFTGEGITGADAAHTRKDPTNLVFLGSIPMPTNATVYRSRPFSIAQAFGSVPAKWGIVVFNDSGVAFSATAGNNKATYQGVLAQI